MARPLTPNPMSYLNIGTNAPKLKLNALCFAKLMEALVHGPCTYEGLEEACGLQIATIRNIINALRGKGAGIERMVRICGWDPDGRGTLSIMVFEFAPGKKDVPRPSIGTAGRSKRYREKLKHRQQLAAMSGPTTTEEHHGQEQASYA